MNQTDTTLPVLRPPWEAPGTRCVCGSAFAEDALFCGACGCRRHEDPRLGTLVLGRYLLVEEIGQGGMGVVYRAEHRVRGFVRRVAVKVLHPDVARSKSIRARFLRECEIVARLSHPNTIRFYDFGELEDGTLAIVMELVEGESLAERIARGPLSLSEAVSVLRQLAGSLHEAHEAGIVHRDVKPDNVVLFERPSMSVGAKLLDFGVAKMRLPSDGGDPLSFHGEVLGTPAYMSPEQISGGALDGRSDVYSLGVLAYEMITGELPYEPARSLAEWAERHLFAEPIPVDDHPAGVALTASAQEAISAALAKEPADRPQSTIAFVRALRGDGTLLGRPRVSPGPVMRTVTPSATLAADDSLVDDELVLPTSRAHRFVAMVGAAVLSGLLALGAAMIPQAAATTAGKSAEVDKASEALAVCEPAEADDC